MVDEPLVVAELPEGRTVISVPVGDGRNHFRVEVDGVLVADASTMEELVERIEEIDDRDVASGV